MIKLKNDPEQKEKGEESTNIENKMIQMSLFSMVLFLSLKKIYRLIYFIHTGLNVITHIDTFMFGQDAK